MATNLQTQETPEYRIFRVHYSRLLHAIQDPLPLAAQLFSDGIITSTVKECMSVSGVPRLDKNNTLLSAVEVRIQNDPTSYQTFLTALREDSSLQSLVESMEGDTGPGVHGEGRPSESKDAGEEQSLPATKRICKEDRICLERVSAGGELPTLTTHVPQHYQHQSHQHLQQSSHRPLYLPPTHPPSYPPHRQVPYLLPEDKPCQPPHPPFHYPPPHQPHPPPCRLPMGEPGYRHSRFFQPPYYQSSHSLSQSPPVQSPQPPTCIYQPPHQPPRHSSYLPSFEPMHMCPPPYQPSPRPPPFRSPMGPPSYEHTRFFHPHHYQTFHILSNPPPVQSSYPTTCIYQHPCQPPRLPPQPSPYQPLGEPIHVYQPPHQPASQSSYQPSSQPTPHPDTPLGKYALFLREWHKLHKAPSTKFPYLDAQSYVNLAVISNEYANREELNKFREQTIHGCVDDILEWKAPIAMKDILQPNQEKLEMNGQEILVNHPVTQLLIEGAPGIGKSTFAWEVCQKWGQHQLFNEYSLVVLLKFRDKRVQEAKSVSDLFYYPLPELQSDIVRDIVLSGGQGLLLILEGLDEAPASKRTMDSIFIRLFTGQELPMATVVLTTRPSASAEPRQLCRGKHSRRIEVVGFGKEEIDQYIRCAFTEGQSISKFNEYLSLYPHIHSAMYVPLNCAIVTHVYKSCTSTSTVPKTMTQLYSSLMRSVLLRHLKDKLEYRDMCTSLHSFKDLPQPVYNQFHGICELAYTGIMSAETKLIFQDLPSDFDPLGLMQTCPELYVDSGASVSYNFLHFTIQEYLAAYYISQQSRDEQVTFMKEQVGNEKLEVVVRFLAGFSLGEFGRDLWDVVRGFASDGLPSHSMLGETECVMLPILQWLFESQDPSSIAGILGSDSVCYSVHVMAVMPFDWYVLGYCIIHSSCYWKLELFGCQVESVETFLKALNLQQDQILSPSKGQIMQMVFQQSDPAAVHLLVANIPQMLVFHNLTHLTLRESQLTSETCNHLYKQPDLLQHLLHLNLDYNPIGRGGAVNLITSLTKFSTIRELHLMKTDNGLEDCKALSELLASSKHIEVLHIGSNNFSPDSIELIVDGLSHNTSLEKLFVSNSNFSSENVLSLASVLRVNTRLKELFIQHCNIQSSDFVCLAEALTANTATQLQKLWLSGNPIGSAGAVAFADMIAINKSLTVLHMLGCSIEGKGAVCLALALEKNSTMKVLVLSHNPIGSAGAVAFADMIATNKSLTVLHMLGCSIEGKGAVCLAEALEKNSTVKVLVLSHNPIGSAGAVAFADMLATNKSLTELKVNGCNIGGEGALAFSSMLKRNSCLKTLELKDDSVGVEGALNLIESLQQNTTLGRLWLSHKHKSPSFSTFDTALQEDVVFL